jgi:excinuclease UvrABC nuclease subunit
MQARQLPETSGVYFWCDELDNVLYIGKARDLRARVTSYFSTAAHDRRIRKLIESSRSIRFEVTLTELEALYRESALIKSEQPPFNRALRTSRQPYFLKFDGARTDPYMEVSRSADDPSSLYFGPFRTGRATRETMAYLHDVLPLRKCKAAKPKCRPCVYYQMHTCAAPALDAVHRSRHQEAIGQLFELLDGRSDKVLRWLVAKRDKLCEALLFERAAEIQERVDALEALQLNHTVLEAAIQCRSVVVRQTVDGDRIRLLLIAHGHVLSVRDGSEYDVESVVRWIQAHGAVLTAMRHSQSEVDAASVLERWIACNRRSVAWVAIPQSCSDDDLRDRVTFVLGLTSEEHAGVPVSVTSSLPATRRTRTRGSQQSGRARQRSTA